MQIRQPQLGQVTERAGQAHQPARAVPRPSEQPFLEQRLGRPPRPRRRGDLPEPAVGVPEAGQRAVAATEVGHLYLPEGPHRRARPFAAHQ